MLCCLRIRGRLITLSKELKWWTSWCRPYMPFWCCGSPVIMVDLQEGMIILILPLYLFVCLGLVGWLCFTSHRQQGHLETAPPFTIPSFQRMWSSVFTPYPPGIEPCQLHLYGFTSLLNIWGHITTVPACSSGTLTNVLLHRNATPQTQDMTHHPVIVYRHGADLSLCYPLMWNVTLKYTATHLNVLGQTRPGNPSPTFHTHQ